MTVEEEIKKSKAQLQKQKEDLSYVDYPHYARRRYLKMKRLKRKIARLEGKEWTN